MGGRPTSRPAPSLSSPTSPPRHPPRSSLWHQFAASPMSLLSHILACCGFRKEAPATHPGGCLPPVPWRVAGMPPPKAAPPPLPAMVGPCHLGPVSPGPAPAPCPAQNLPGLGTSDPPPLGAGPVLEPAPAQPGDYTALENHAQMAPDAAAFARRAKKCRFYSPPCDDCLRAGNHCAADVRYWGRQGLNPNGRMRRGWIAENSDTPCPPHMEGRLIRGWVAVDEDSD